MKKKKKKSPQDTTLRNAKASKKASTKLEDRIKGLEATVEALKSKVMSSEEQ